MPVKIVNKHDHELVVHVMHQRPGEEGWSRVRDVYVPAGEAKVVRGYQHDARAVVKNVCIGTDTELTSRKPYVTNDPASPGVEFRVHLSRRHVSSSARTCLLV